MFIVFLLMLGCGDNDCSPFLEVTTVSMWRVAIDKNEIRSVSEEIMGDKKVTHINTRYMAPAKTIQTVDAYDDITHQLSCTE
jgi:hypothetical protein